MRCLNLHRRAAQLQYKIQIQLNDIFFAIRILYTIPCAIMAWATFMKPAMLAPFT